MHERLGERIEHYLGADTIPGLYRRILARYEEDYERDRPDLARDAVTLLWAAPRGLSEAELLEMLGEGGEPLPRAAWSPLYLAAEASLITRSGLIGFAHDYLRQAVRDKYLPDRADRQAADERVADYFEAQDLGPRKADELPWQLAEADGGLDLLSLGEVQFLTGIGGGIAVYMRGIAPKGIQAHATPVCGRKSAQKCR